MSIRIEINTCDFYDHLVIGVELIFVFKILSCPLFNVEKKVSRNLICPSVFTFRKPISIF